MKYIYLTIGIISLILGLIGVFFPILPTTPFLLLTSFCFAKGSKKFHNWFLNTKIYEKHLKDFIDKREMPFKTKLFLMIFSSSVIIISIFLVDIFVLKIFLIILDLFKYYYFIFKIKTI